MKKLAPRIHLLPLLLIEDVRPQPPPPHHRSLLSEVTRFAPGDAVVLNPSAIPGIYSPLSERRGLNITEDDVVLYADLRRLMPTLTIRQQQTFSALFEHNMSIESVSHEFHIGEADIRYHRGEIALKLVSLKAA